MPKAGRSKSQPIRLWQAKKAQEDTKAEKQDRKDNVVSQRSKGTETSRKQVASRKWIIKGGDGTPDRAEVLKKLRILEGRWQDGAGTLYRIKVKELKITMSQMKRKTGEVVTATGHIKYDEQIDDVLMETDMTSWILDEVNEERMCWLPYPQRLRKEGFEWSRVGDLPEKAKIDAPNAKDEEEDAFADCASSDGERVKEEKSRRRKRSGSPVQRKAPNGKVPAADEASKKGRNANKIQKAPTAQTTGARTRARSLEAKWKKNPNRSVATALNQTPADWTYNSTRPPARTRASSVPPKSAQYPKQSKQAYGGGIEQKWNNTQISSGGTTWPNWQDAWSQKRVSTNMKVSQWKDEKHKPISTYNPDLWPEQGWKGLAKSGWKGKAIERDAWPQQGKSGRKGGNSEQDSWFLKGHDKSGFKGKQSGGKGASWWTDGSQDTKFVSGKLGSSAAWLQNNWQDGTKSFNIKDWQNSSAQPRGQNSSAQPRAWQGADQSWSESSQRANQQGWSSGSRQNFESSSKWDTNGKETKQGAYTSQAWDDSRPEESVSYIMKNLEGSWKDTLASIYRIWVGHDDTVTVDATGTSGQALTKGNSIWLDGSGYIVRGGSEAAWWLISMTNQSTTWTNANGVMMRWTRYRPRQWS